MHIIITTALHHQYTCRYSCSEVRLCVGQTGQLCWNGRTSWDAISEKLVWDGPKKPLSHGPRSTHEKGKRRVLSGIKWVQSVQTDTITKVGGVQQWYICFCQITLDTCLQVLWHCWLGIRKSIRLVKIEWWGVGVVTCLEQGADCLHMV